MSHERRAADVALLQQADEHRKATAVHRYCPDCGQSIPPSFQAFLIAARQQRSLSQREMGRRLSPPRSHVAYGDIERGKTAMTVDLIVQLAHILECDPVHLFARAFRDVTGDHHE